MLKDFKTKVICPNNSGHDASISILEHQSHHAKNDSDR